MAESTNCLIFLLSLSLALIMLWSGQLFSQDPFPAECGLDSTYQVENEPSSGQEGGSSNGHFCAFPNHNHVVFSDLPRHMPQGERIKVRANFIIVQKQDGTGNFQDIPEHRELLDDWFARCNEVFDNSWWGSQGACLPAASRADIEIVPSWIFLPDPSGENFYWNLDNAGPLKTSACPNFGSWWLNGLDQMINNDPTNPKGINVYFTVDQDIHDRLVVLGTIDDPQQAGMFYTWCSEHPTRFDMNRPSRIADLPSGGAVMAVVRDTLAIFTNLPAVAPFYYALEAFTTEGESAWRYD